MDPVPSLSTTPYELQQVIGRQCTYYRFHTKRPSTKLRIFHPDFPTSSPLGGAIIECQGGISFRFPLDLLSASAPFATASELSLPLVLTADTDAQSQEVIVLDNVSPRGFHLCLTALHPSTPYFTDEAKTARLNSLSIDAIIEGFNTADFLDMPDLASLLIPHFENPFLQFALSTGSNDPPLIQQMAEKTFSHPFDEMQGRAERLVIAPNPSYHPRLRHLHEKRNRVPKRLVSAMVDSQTCDQYSGFAPSCERKSCPALLSAKTWQQLRARGASQVYEALQAGHVSPCKRAKVAEVVLQGSCKGCNRCRQRLLNSFVRVFDKLEAELPVDV